MRDLLDSLRIPLTAAALISTGVNALMLVSPIFMMQVFDRVLMSGNLDTLFSLTFIAVVALMLLGALETLRQQVLARAGDWLEARSADRVIDAALGKRLPAEQVFGQVEQVKRFFCASGVFALLDAPWVLVFAGLLWWMHPVLGMIALASAILLFGIALATEFTSRKPLLDAQSYKGQTQAILSSALRNSDSVRAMGMGQELRRRWHAAAQSGREQQTLAGDRSAVFSGAAKAIRLIVQTAVLASGALLVLDGGLSAGGMIAASILLGRCLAPVEQSIGAWKQFILAQKAWKELAELEIDNKNAEATALGVPKGQIELEGVSWKASEDGPSILIEINLRLEPGTVTCLVGPSGSGKTSLTRLLMGLAEPSEGTVRLDGRAINGWNRSQLGPHIGYLPQTVELLPGTIKDNICRFGEGSDTAIVAAAKLARADDLIRRFADGYETVIDPFRPLPMSAGQMQRVGLARALYGTPRVVVLDEPNANLDTAGEAMLCEALKEVAATGATVLVVSHRPSAIKAADRLVVMKQGRIIKDGPANELLGSRSKPAMRVPVPAADPHTPATAYRPRSQPIQRVFN